MVWLYLLVGIGNIYSQEPISKQYKVGPGDVLNIQVWDHNDLNRVIEVSQDGSFSFPFIGQINVLEHSVYEIESLLAKKLGDGYIVGPQVVITVDQYNNKKVYLFGEVQRPGSYPIRGDVRLLELISEAGGFTDNRGSTCKIVRPKENSQTDTPVSIENAEPHEIMTIDLYLLLAGYSRENIVLMPGDSVYINQVDHFFVIGEVRSPGEVKWKSGLTVRQAISIAGGGTPNAAVGRTRIVRLVNGQEVEIKPGLSDPVLPNDIVKVPQSYF